MKLFQISLLFFFISSSYAWTIGQKTRVNGPSIHSTYFMTPQNGVFDVQAQAYVGYFISGTCQYNTIYNIGQDKLRTGDYIAIDGFQLKALVGGGYNCMSLVYFYKQQVFETFRLLWDGVNYIGSAPATSDVSIL